MPFPVLHAVRSFLQQNNLVAGVNLIQTLDVLLGTRVEIVPRALDHHTLEPTSGGNFQRDCGARIFPD